MQPIPEQLQFPVLHPRQNGEVIFFNQEKNLTYILGDDGKIYASTDRLTLKELVDASYRKDMPMVSFLPISGSGGHSACCVELVQTTPSLVSLSIPSNSFQKKCLAPVEAKNVQMPSIEVKNIPANIKKDPITTISITEENVQNLSEDDLHQLLNDWYEIPEKFNKPEFPFPCEGFIVLGNDKTELMIFTRRLGCVTIKEDPKREGRSYCYFMVCGPGIYRAFEYVDLQPPTFKSTKFVNSFNIETKGYALLGHGKRTDSESQWWAWNDQTGFMRCQAGSARILKNKYSTWEPTAQMVMFDAQSTDNGRNWMIKTLSYIDYATARQQKFFPLQAYFIDNLEVLPLSEQPNPAEEIVFQSNKIKDKVYARISHVMSVPKRAGCKERYAGVIFATWGKDGLSRRYRALIAAPMEFWEPPRHNLAELAQILEVPNWDKNAASTRN